MSLQSLNQGALALFLTRPTQLYVHSFSDTASDRLISCFLRYVKRELDKLLERMPCDKEVRCQILVLSGICLSHALLFSPSVLFSNNMPNFWQYSEG